MSQQCKNSACLASFSSSAKVHWEGGAGCRDKTRMGRNDKKKYAGIQKTVSRKALANKKPGQQKKKG